MFRLLTILFLFISSALSAQISQHTSQEYITHAGSKADNAAYYQNSKMNYYDIKHLQLDISVMPKSTYIIANCNYTILINQALDTFAIEFKQAMQLDSVLLNHTKTIFSQANDHIYIPLQPTAAAGTLIDLSFYYKGNVAAGFFAGTDANGLDFTASLSEAFQAREWFPAKQLLNDKIDSTDIWIITGMDYQAGSNGLLKAVITLPGNKRQFKWSCRYPLNYYMPSVAVGNYLEYNVYAKPAAIAPDSILVQNLLYNNTAYFNQVKPQLDKTPRFIEKFSELFGIYPFYKEKYGHSQADIGGGMEHATMTTLKNFDEQLVAHELAHQWFGDNVTCASWKDIWLNESFATYSQYLAIENLPNLFTTTAAQVMTGFHKSALSDSSGSVYVPASGEYNESRIFNYKLSYAKGAVALHNLRFEMQNDSLFFKILQTYQRQFANSFATTANFKEVAEQVSGKSLTDFFNQKIYGEGYPVYNVTYNKQADTLILQVNQITSSPGVTPFFNGVMEYKILSEQGDTIIKVRQTTNVQRFAIYYPKTLKGLEVDPNNWVLNGVGNIKEGISIITPSPNDITVFPNPVKDKLTIRFPPGNYTLIRFFGVDGRLVANYPIAVGASVFTQNLHLPPGIYFLHLVGSKGSSVKKILINNW